MHCCVCDFTVIEISDLNSLLLIVAALTKHLPPLLFLSFSASPAIYCAGQADSRETSPVWNNLSSQHYQPNTPPSILCYKGLSKLLFLLDMIKEMLPYVHVFFHPFFYCPTLEHGHAMIHYTGN